MEGKQKCINVGIRVRPSHNAANYKSETIKILQLDIPILYLVDTDWCYPFENIFSQDSNQEDVYQRMVHPLVKQVLSGYNCTVIGYGQTGSGKSYTIGTNPEKHNAGCILKILDEFFNNQEDQKGICISISFYEIYDDLVYDLLSAKNSDPLTGFNIQGLTQETIKNYYEAYSFLKLGSKNRHIQDAKRYNNNSNSHTIFTIHCRVKHENHETSAQFNLIDLADSEDVKNIKIEDLDHAGRIATNIDLQACGNLPNIGPLVTLLLRGSVNIANFVTLIACVSPDAEDITETMHTLDFAQKLCRAKKKQRLVLITCEENQNTLLLGKSVLGSKLKLKAKPLKRSSGFLMKTFNTLKRAKSMNDMNVTEIKHCENRIMNNSSPINSARSSCMSATCSNITIANISQSAGRQINELSSVFNLQQSRYFNSSPQCVVNILNQTIDIQNCSNNNTGDCHTNSNVISFLPSKIDFDDAVPYIDVKSLLMDCPGPPTKKQKRSPTLKHTQNNLLNDSLDAGPSTSSTTQLHNFSVDTNFPRRSMRLASKKLSEDAIINIPSNTNPMRTLKKSSLKKSNIPHSNYVLNLLNTGTVRDLQKLSYVGYKTATQIHTFRQLNGRFKSVNDLRKMPSWRGNGFQRFLKENFLNMH